MVTRHRSRASSSAHRLVEVERSGESLIVTFEDGRTAVFDADWMYGQIPQARLVVEPGEEGPRPPRV